MNREKRYLERICKEDTNLISIEVIPVTGYCDRIHKENKLKKDNVKYEALDNCLYIERRM